MLIRRSVKCNYPWKLTIDDTPGSGDGVRLFAADRIHIHANAVVSQQAYLCRGTHDHLDPLFGLVTKPIVVGQGGWVALGALVMPGVSVEKAPCWPARTVLARDAQPRTVYVGQPARAVGRREFRDETVSDQRSSNIVAS